MAELVAEDGPERAILGRLAGWSFGLELFCAEQFCSPYAHFRGGRLCRMRAIIIWWNWPWREPPTGSSLTITALRIVSPAGLLEELG